MAQDSILGRLVERWHVQYDRVIWNLYGILLAIAGIIGKDIILGNKSLQEILKAGSVASWYVLLATLMLTSFLFWYNYTSYLLSFASFLLIENDALYKKFWADRSRIRASKFQVLVSNCIFYALPLFVVVYYNVFALADLNTILNTNLIFDIFAMFCGLYFLTAFIMRIITLLRIRAKFKLLLENIEKQSK